MDPILKTACATLSTAFVPARLGAQLDMLRGQVREKSICQEIEEFLVDFHKSLNSFMILYGLN